MTYEAILQDNKLEWKDAIPRQITKHSKVAVYVTILDELTATSEKIAQGRKMAQALASLSALDERSIVDPLKWQAETRQDRPLPR
ncbi:MAG: hypothetical protein GY803_05045 [Chloroflexi bacterium]|nr:hypothetical protein [Chloroflexota bacterium]